MGGFKKDSLSFIISEFAYSEEVTFRSNYSSRGNYGETCIGVICGKDKLNNLIKGILKHLAAEMLEEAICNPNVSSSEFEDSVDAIFKYRTDIMGLNTIHYWPDLKVDTV